MLPNCTTKRCPKCGQVKPFSEFHKDRTSSSGLQTHCKACRCKPKPSIPEGFKVCTVCNQLKPITDFPRKSSSKDGLDYRCKDCRKEYQRKRRATPEGHVLMLEAARRNQQSEHGQAYRAVYDARESTKARERASAYRRLHTPEGQASLAAHNASEQHKESMRRYLASIWNDPDKRRKYAAVNKVNCTIRDGKMPPARDLPCAHCGSQAAQYHHHLGYEREHWLDVIPLCQDCHDAEHLMPH